MSTEFWDHVPRKPRHEATDVRRVQVQVERLAHNCQETLEGTLVDLSRQGVQCILNEELGVPEAVRVRIRDTESGFDYQLTADTRWCRPIEGEPANQQLWSVGCQFDSEADWEAIGELLLSGALSMG